MMKLRTFSFLFLLTGLLVNPLTTPPLLAAEKNKSTEGTEEADVSPAVSQKNFLCVKMKKATLADLKKNLLENCNLEKPYSVSTADTALDSSYVFCCHTAR